MAKWISISGMLVGGIGIFFGFYYLGEDPAAALAYVTLTTVGCVGLFTITS